MTIELSTPGVDGLSDVVRALREWQHDTSPMQLHPGDLGWFWQFGAEAAALAIRTWSRDGQVLAVETPDGTLVQDSLTDAGWDLGEPWTPLRRDLTEPVEEPDVRIEVVGSEEASAYTAVHRSAFGSARFTDELWHTMAGGLP